MPKAFVLLTAMPPTKGHERLIEFATGLGDGIPKIILCTQPGEPYVSERWWALKVTCERLGADLRWIHQTLPQEPEGQEGFWEMWGDFLSKEYFAPGDYVVASEHYGARLAEEVAGIFIPYDIQRELYPAKATQVRNRPHLWFNRILPEFQPYLRKTITIFGAESTGKTTLAKALSVPSGHFLFEYARPYLEEVGAEVTLDRMNAIWHGQAALQKQGQRWIDKPFIVQDTDLFSTVGYWDYWSSQDHALGRTPTPDGLIREALKLESDLYLITPSNIPFEPDPLRYGDNVRELDDAYWIALCEKYELPYQVLTGKDRSVREGEGYQSLWDLFYSGATLDLVNYQREGAEYASTH